MDSEEISRSNDVPDGLAGESAQLRRWPKDGAGWQPTGFQRLNDVHFYLDALPIGPNRLHRILNFPHHLGAPRSGGCPRC